MVPVGWQNRVPVWAYGAAASVAIALFAVVLSADLGGLLTSETSTPDLPTQAVETAVESTIIPQPAPGIEVPSVAETELQAPLEDAVEAVKEVDTESALLDSTDLIPARSCCARAFRPRSCSGDQASSSGGVPSGGVAS